MRFVWTNVWLIVVFTLFIILVMVYKLNHMIIQPGARLYIDTFQVPEELPPEPPLAPAFQLSLDTVSELDSYTEPEQPLEAESEYESPAGLPLWKQTLDFDQLNFSNETGNPSGCYVVPNYIHYVHFGGIPLRYVYMICILAALKNQKPEKVVFHYDNATTFTGKYWEVLLQTPGFKEVLVLHKIELPSEIYGQPLSVGWRKWHASDITRIRMVMKYGGIFLDNDCYLVKNVDNYRKFEISINWDENQFLGSQVIIAHKNARFLRKWLETYKVYDKTKWYYNAGERPTVEVLYKQPELIHRVKVLFGADNKFIYNLFQEQWSGWKDFYIMHLLVGHQYVLKSINNKATFPVEFNEINIAYYPVTFRDMAYEVYDFAKIKWPRNRY